MSKRSPARIPYIPLLAQSRNSSSTLPLFPYSAILGLCFVARYSAVSQAAPYSHCVGRPQCGYPIRTVFTLCGSPHSAVNSSRTVFTLCVTKHGLHVRSHVVKPCWIHAPLSSLVVGTYRGRVSETVIADRRNQIGNKVLSIKTAPGNEKEVGGFRTPYIGHDPKARDVQQHDYRPTTGLITC